MVKLLFLKILSLRKEKVQVQNMLEERMNYYLIKSLTFCEGPPQVVVRLWESIGNSRDVVLNNKVDNLWELDVDNNLRLLDTSCN